MSHHYPATNPELASAIRHRRPFGTSVRVMGRNVRVEGCYIAVLSYHLSRFDLVGDLADGVVRSAKDLHERYVEKQPAIAFFPMTRQTHPLRIVEGEPEQEPNPGAAEPHLRALYSDEAIYYVTTTQPEETTAVLGYVSAGGEARVDSGALALLASSCAAAVAEGLHDAAVQVRKRTAGDPHFFDGPIVERDAILAAPLGQLPL